MQFGSVVYNSRTAAGALVPPIASNGTSIAAGVIQLGGPQGAAAAANLLNNREIPLNGFSLTYSGIGQAAAGNIIYKAAAGIALTQPMESWQSSTGTELAHLIINSRDIYFGVQSGISVTAQNLNNTCVGSQSGQVLTTGNHNSFFGAFSGQAVVAGTQNVAMGYASLDQADSSSCTAIGDHCMGSIAGTFLTAVGQAAMSGSVTAATGLTQQVAIGAGALQQTPSATGTNDIWIGYKCGFNAGVSQGSNTMVGSLIQSTSINTYGSGNILLGANINSSGNPGLGNNNIFIGANIVFGNPVITNSTVIGQGYQISVSNVVVLGRSDQSVIIAATSPVTVDNGAQLQINGSVSYAIRSTAANTALNAKTDHTLILTAGGLTITNTAPATGTGQFFLVVNQAAASNFSVGYVPLTGGATVTTIPANAPIGIQWSAALANWQRVI